MVKTTDGPTSVTAVLIHPDGERSFVVQRGASHELKERQISDDLLRKYDLLYIGSACGIPGLDGEGLTSSFTGLRCLTVRRLWILPGNPTRRSAAQLLPALPNLDFFLPSAYEAMDLSGRDSPGKAADYFHEKGVPVVAVKMGGQGALLSAGGKQEVFPAYEGPVVDTTGAGDAFVAGFLAALSRGESLPGCVQIGNGAGAKCVERLGSSGTLPAYQELISFTGLHRE